ncbi:U-box domain-containing protein 38-like [Silene latifolia]|uniref:U-box domain-containing protein 38-like n=1 Tax=Silene latifolia TaxID=37657 RepID=UPI003D788267
MGKNGQFLKLKLSLFRSSSSPTRTSTPPPPPSSPPSPPSEYICPVCQTLFTEPVVIGSGHTFDRTCVQACLDLNYTPNLSDGTCPDFSSPLIPNLALQSAIPKWCDENGVVLPSSKSCVDVMEKLRVDIFNNDDDNCLIRPSERFLIDEVMKVKPNPDDSHAMTMFTRKVNRFDSTSSDESVIAAASPLTPLPLKTRPACWSSYGGESSSSEAQTSGEVVNPNFVNSDENDEEIVAKFKSDYPHDQEQGAILLRKITRKDENSRIKLCTARLLREIQPLLISSYESVQVNAIAALVNLSLEKENKIKIVRSGIVPIVVDLLKGRLSETQEHAAGVIFSLSLEEKNRTAIGVLQALPPLMHCLIRSDSDRTRSDSALALYNLALDHNNRVKLVRLGAVPPLLAVLRSANEAISGRVLLVLCQLAASAEGKAAMLDGNAVEHLVAMLRSTQSASESTRENCVAALYALSHGSLRFKALARDARAVEVLKAVEESGSERAKEKARRLLVVLKPRRESVDEESDDVDWEAILASTSAGIGPTRPRVGPGHGGVGNTTEF